MLPGLKAITGGQGGISGKTSQSTGDTVTRTTQGGGVDLNMGGDDGAIPWEIIAVSAVAIVGMVVVIRK